MKRTAHDHKNCLSIFNRFSEYLDGELTQKDCREIRRHLRVCQDCRTCLEALKRTIALCKSLKPAMVPESLKAKLKMMVNP
jgi:anti-sigma factor RsiW